jgi:molybdopterin synthase sulfur carrier subunit
MIKILYFSWVREKLGISEELLNTKANNINELIDELRWKDEKYKLAFDDLDIIRIAVDQKLVDIEYPLKDVSEVAFFPPMTGG